MYRSSLADDNDDLSDAGTESCGSVSNVPLEDGIRDEREPEPDVKEDGISSEGTNVPGPEYCLLIFEGFGVTFFSGGRS